MNTAPRTAVVLGGNRIPFARSNGPYADASNQDMLTAALDGLVGALRPAGRARSARSSPAPCSSTAATSTSPASPCSARGSHPTTPAYDVQQACDTGLQAAIARRQQDRPRPDRRRHRRRHRHHVRRADRPSTRTCARCCWRPTRAKSPAGRLKLLGRAAPGAPRARDPAQRRAAHRPVHGRARRPITARSGASRARRRTSWPRASHQHLAAAYDARLLRRPGHARSSAWSATRTCGPTRPSRSSPRSSRCSARATARR